MEPFEIRIKINDESDLYNSYDPDKTTLRGDLIDYLTERYTEKEYGRKAVLVFAGTDIDGERLNKALHHHVENLLEANRKQKRLNQLRQLRLFLIGLVFVAAGILLKNLLASVPVEILSIIGSFAVWEAANIWIVENPKLNLRKRFLEKLLDADVVIGPV